MLVAQPGIGRALSALSIHEWWHATQAVEAAFRVGDDPSRSLEREERILFNAALQRERAHTVFWFIGYRDAPVEARKAASDAEAKAFENTGFSRAIPPVDGDPIELRKKLDSEAVFSIRLGVSSGEVLLLTRDAANLKSIAGVQEVRRAAVALGNRLEVAAEKEGQMDPSIGDILRTRLIDIHQRELEGVGRYLIIPDGPLWGFSLNVLPEQKLGRRFLADIRSVSVGVTLTSALQENGDIPESYEPDYFGISPAPGAKQSKGGLKLPNEVENAGRLFSGAVKSILVADEATPEAFLETSPSARYIHLADILTGAHGGIVLTGGEVGLEEIRGLDLESQIVVLSADMSADVVLRRAQTFRAAGADSILFSTWLVSEAVRGRLIYAFYEARNRDHTPARSLTEARRILQSDSNENYFDPSWWGQYILAGRP